MKLPGPMELVIILGIVLLIFGAGRLPEIGSALGKGISAFKRGVTGENKPEEEPVEASEKTEIAQVVRPKRGGSRTAPTRLLASLALLLTCIRSRQIKEPC